VVPLRLGEGARRVAAACCSRGFCFVPAGADGEISVARMRGRGIEWSCSRVCPYMCPYMVLFAYVSLYVSLYVLICILLCVHVWSCSRPPLSTPLHLSLPPPGPRRLPWIKGFLAAACALDLRAPAVKICARMRVCAHARVRARQYVRARARGRVCVREYVRASVSSFACHVPVCVHVGGWVVGWDCAARPLAVPPPPPPPQRP